MILSTPTTDHLSRLYFELARHGAPSVGQKRSWPYKLCGPEELFCLACEMSRYDPRLMTVLVQFLMKKWSDLNPTRMRHLHKKMTTPQTMAVIAEFVLRNTAETELRYYGEYLQQGLRAVSLQYYFHHLYSPGGTLARRATEIPLAEYKRWGFLACEAPLVNEKDRTVGGTWDALSRLNQLKRLLQEKREIRMTDYLSACRWTISRQQALNDLKSVDWMVMVGRGKGARWRMGSP